MSSDSDSDEQFESADEDFEFEELSPAVPQPNKAKDEVLDKLAQLNLKENPKSITLNENPTNQIEACEKNYKDLDVIEKGDSNVVKKSSKEASCLTKNDTERDNGEKVKTLDCKEIAGVNKEDILTQVVDPVTSVPSVEEIKPTAHCKSSSQNATSNTDEKTGTLGSFSSRKKDVKDILATEPKPSADCDGWDVHIDDDIGDFIPTTESELANNAKHEIPQEEEAFASDVASSIVVDNLISKYDVQSKASVKDNVSRDTGVDGWDVEVEDGFEIPVDLNKSHASGTTEQFPFSLTTPPLQKLTNSKVSIYFICTLGQFL